MYRSFLLICLFFSFDNLMSQVHLITPTEYSDDYGIHNSNSYAYNKELLDRMYCLRNDIFVEKLKWDIKSVNGREKDQYDENSAFYLVYVDGGGEVRGCMRLIEMVNECMFDGPFNFALQISDSISNESPKSSLSFNTSFVHSTEISSSHLNESSNLTLPWPDVSVDDTANVYENNKKIEVSRPQEAFIYDVVVVSAFSPFNTSRALWKHVCKLKHPKKTSEVILLPNENQEKHVDSQNRPNCMSRNFIDVKRPGWWEMSRLCVDRAYAMSISPYSYVYEKREADTVLSEMFARFLDFYVEHKIEEVLFIAFPRTNDKINARWPTKLINLASINDEIIGVYSMALTQAPREMIFDQKMSKDMSESLSRGVIAKSLRAHLESKDQI